MCRLRFVRTKLLVALLLVVLGPSLVSSGSVLADEFELGIALGDDVDVVEFMAGFQLAVDESPDISHPAGIEGGDHLGGIDVTITSLARRSDDGLVEAAADAGFPITVVDSSSENFDAMAERVSALDRLFIVFVDRVSPELLRSPSLFVVNYERAEAIAELLSPSFAADFAAAHGRPHSSAAARGYAAGRLIDVAVEATDRDPADAPTLRRALDSTIKTDSPEAVTSLPAPESEAPAEGLETNWSALQTAAVVVVVVALSVGGLTLVVYVCVLRRSFPPGVRSDR